MLGVWGYEKLEGGVVRALRCDYGEFSPSSTIATALIHPPLAPLILTGKQKKVKPQGGS